MSIEFWKAHGKLPEDFNSFFCELKEDVTILNTGNCLAVVQIIFFWFILYLCAFHVLLANPRNVLISYLHLKRLIP